MTTIRTTDPKRDELKDKLLLRIDTHHLYAKSTKHHDVVSALRSKHEDKTLIEDLLAELEREGLILSRKNPVPTYLGEARIHSLRKRGLEIKLGKKK